MRSTYFKLDAIIFCLCFDVCATRRQKTLQKATSCRSSSAKLYSNVALAGMFLGDIALDEEDVENIFGETADDFIESAGSVDEESASTDDAPENAATAVGRDRRRNRRNRKSSRERTRTRARETPSALVHRGNSGARRSSRRDDGNLRDDANTSDNVTQVPHCFSCPWFVYATAAKRCFG